MNPLILTTLGTGAGRPSLHRNSSAVTLDYEGELFLFDCGEATQIQIMKSQVRWGKLSAIFIGHLHGDHFNGLPGLLATLSMSDREAPLKLYGPEGILDIITVLRKYRVLYTNYPLEIHEIKQEGILLETSQFYVETRFIDHVIPCWGFAFQEKDLPGEFDAKKADALRIPHGPMRGDLVKGKSIQLENGEIISAKEVVGPKRPGRRIVYCLDSRPCEGGQKLAKNADCLIHEATFSACLGEEAHDWGHSTTIDAAKLALEAGVKKLILTHISQRYDQAKDLLEEAREIFPSTYLAEDLKVFEL